MDDHQLNHEIHMMIRQYDELSGDTLTRTSMCIQGAGVHQDFKNLDTMHAWCSGATAALERSNNKRGMR